MSIGERISIIVPIYNSAKYLQFTLDSIMAQTYNNYELILVDDGSTDESASICRKYVAMDSRVTYYYKINGGVSTARNLGMENANGKWITFVDSDDYLCSEYLENMVKATTGYDYDWIISTYRMISRDKLKNEGIDAYIKIAGINDLYAKSISDCKYMFPKLDGYPGVMSCDWRKFYKKDIIKTNNLRFTDIQSEDELFDMQYCCHITSFRSIKYAGYCYIDNPDSISKWNKCIAEIDWISLIWQSYEIIKDRFVVDDETYWDGINKRMLVRYSAYIRKGYFKDTRIPYLKRMKRWKEVIDDSYFKRMKWKHTWTLSTKICFILSKFRLYYIGDFVLLFIDGRHIN